MNFWLVCCVLMFLGAEGLQWVAQVQGFNEIDLSWPLIVLGGLGLAIASNRWPRLRSPTPALKEPSQVPPSQPPTVAEPLPPASQPTVSSQASPPQKGRPISFEIRKPGQ